MNKFNEYFGVVLGIMLSGCGKVENLYSPVVLSGPAPKSVVCKVYETLGNLSVIPDLTLISPTGEVQLDNMSFPSKDENTPFDAFLGTSVSHITKNFAMSCTVTYKVTKSGAHTFALTSDDGSKLYVNGVLQINNDGPHGTVTKSASPNLLPGNYTVRVDYFENQGPKELSVTVKEPNPVATTL